MNVVELRRYVMKPGGRDALIALFEREFVETQEAVGARLIGTFRDLDRPDRFVWLRGFADMERRREALSDFYSGPAWKAHREAANATMIDSDDVLLLKPPSPHAGFALPAGRAPVGTAGQGKGVIAAHLWRPGGDDQASLAARFERLTPALARDGAAPIAWFVIEHAENSFPALPVRTGERMMVWFSAHADEAAQAATVSAVAEAASAAGVTAAETLRLQPTARSLLRGRDD